MSINKTDRLKEVIAILAKHGLITDWLKQSGVPIPTSIIDKYTKDQKLKLPERIRLAIIDLGPTYIKLGQMLSTKEDLVGADMAKELALLQQDVPADTKKQILATFKTEFGGMPEDLFKEFEYKALASASIGQVHIAKLKTGKKVVVKIQHAGIEEKIEGDLAILNELADLAIKYGDTNIKNSNPKGFVREFSQTLRKEMDYRIELRNTDLFYNSFLYEDSIRFPKTYPQLSGLRVFTMEFLEGESLGNIKEKRPKGFDGDALALTCTNMYLDMVFKNGIYHADPHPGNIKVIQGKILGILDCGMVGYVDNHLKEDFEVIVSALIEKDSIKLTKAVIEMGNCPENLDREALRDDLSNFINEVIYVPLEHFNIKDAFNGLTNILKTHQISFPPAIISILKLLAMLEGTMKIMSPTFSLAKAFEEYSTQLMLAHFTPKGLIQKFQHSIIDWTKLIDSFPGEIRDILIRLRKGSIQINLNHQGLERTAQLLVLGILASSLFISSALLWTSKAPPLFKENSLLGAIGFLAAFILVMFIIAHLMKSKKD